MRQRLNGVQEPLPITHLLGYPGSDRSFEVAMDFREATRSHRHRQPRCEPGLFGSSRVPRTPVQDCVLLETLRHLIDRVRTEGVEEGRSVRGDVLSDDDAVLR